MSDELIQTVIETADEAKRHRIELQELLDELDDAKTQIKESAMDAQQKLCNHFTSLKVCIVNSLDQRLTELRQDVTSVEKCALEPLESCETLIRKEAQKADGILAEGKVLLSGDVDSAESAKLMTDFKARISALDLNSLPEVPSLQEVACIHVDLPKDSTDIESQLMEAIQEYGQVIGRAPVQIVETQPRPGALLVKWAETQTEDPDSDINEFNVRCCKGDLRRDPNLKEFTDVYLGHSQQAIMRRLTDGVLYSFQVRGRPQGEDTWSPWSVPCVAMTTIGAYKWKRGVPGYDLDSTCTSIARTNTLTSVDCQFSSDAVFECGQSINFKVAACGECHDVDAIGLCLRGSVTDTKESGILLVSSNGRVFVDGQEKTTKLPPLKHGSVVSFDTEILTSSKVRVTVEIDDKILTIDWCIDKSQTSGSTSPLQNVRRSMEIPKLSPVYFFAKLFNPGWQISVE